MYEHGLHTSSLKPSKGAVFERKLSLACPRCNEIVTQKHVY